MENIILVLFEDLVCSLSRKLLTYSGSESQMLKVFKVAIDRALKENRFEKLKMKDSNDD